MGKKPTSINLFQGDCLAFLKSLPDDSLDSIVSDPPYGLSKITTEDTIEAMKSWIEGKPYIHKKKGFMGSTWDSFVPGPEVWKECFRVLKPGGHLVAFAGTRTIDLMGIAIRLSGFEIRNELQWVYGSGFPKSMDISKQFDKMAGAKRQVIGKKEDSYRDIRKLNGAWEKGEQIQDRVSVEITAPATELSKQWNGWGTGLKPAHEPIVLARKPISEKTVAENVKKWGTGAINIDACRIEVVGEDTRSAGNRTKTFGKQSDAISGGEGSPEYIPSDLGRFPANVIHDGSDEIEKEFLKQGGIRTPGHSPKTKIKGFGKHYGGTTEYQGQGPKTEAGSASRFFNSCSYSEEDYAPFLYTSKSSKKERNEGCELIENRKNETKGHGLDRVCEFCGIPQLKAKDCYCETKSWIHPNKNGNNHPTVKPVAVMEWLIKLVTPPGGTVLDPFMGSGTTGKAAVKNGFKFIGCELSEDYYKIAKARINYEESKISKSKKRKTN